MAAIDFSPLLSNVGVQLEQAAYNAFGAAVDQFTQQPMGNQYSGYQIPSSMPSTIGGRPFSNFRAWNGTNYASDLLTYQPKHRFMFRVLFEMEPDFTDLVGRRDVFQYVIKHIDRPKLSFDYEPVNMYNFKTKVLKTINHEPLTITLIDDVQDTFHTFFRKHLKAFSPASRTWGNSQSLQQLEQSGFNFIDENSQSGVDSAVRGTLRNDKINPFRGIRVIQYFGHGFEENTFHFINPRIIDISYDEAHHEGGDMGNHATIRFDYDILYVEEPKRTQGRSPYAAPGSDMSGPVTGNNIYGRSSDYSSMLSGSVMNQITNGTYGGYNGTNPLTSVMANTVNGIIGNAVNTVSSSVLSGISNPFLNNVARNVVFKTNQSIQQTTTNTIYGNYGGKPMNPGFTQPLVVED